MELDILQKTALIIAIQAATFALITFEILVK